jgi:glycosyltransferase involved in cell wall biosynthesis
MQNKLLEYMALGIPAVTSPVGLEGLQATPGVHLLLAETPQDWVDHICWLLQSPDHGKSIASAARNLVERCYSWEALIAPLRVAIAKRLRSA